MSRKNESQLGRPLAKVTTFSADCGLPYFIIETKKINKHYKVSDILYIVRETRKEKTVCAKQVYSQSVNDTLRTLYGEKYVVE